MDVLQGHSEDVTCAVLTSKGRFAVTGSLDGTAQVWDLRAQDVGDKNVHQGKVSARASLDSHVGFMQPVTQQV